MFEQLGLIGCGLMGGSFSLALKRAGLVKRVVGYSKSPEDLHLARELGVVDMAAPSAQMAAVDSDIVLLAVPVMASEATFKTVREMITPTTLLMDVGSTKRDVVDAARRVLRERFDCFVPAHPIAGREVSVVENADPDLYTGQQVILTPLERTAQPQLEKARALWTALGCTLREMTPEAHDAAFAAVSHLPHLLAFALIKAISAQGAHGEAFLSMAGPGFRDFTRIAAADPAMWRDILVSNRQELLAQSEHFKRALTQLEKLIADSDGDTLQAQIEQISELRATWRMNSSGKGR